MKYILLTFILISQKGYGFGDAQFQKAQPSLAKITAQCAPYARGSLARLYSKKELRTREARYTLRKDSFDFGNGTCRNSRRFTSLKRLVSKRFLNHLETHPEMRQCLNNQLNKQDIKNIRQLLKTENLAAAFSNTPTRRNDVSECEFYEFRFFLKSGVLVQFYLYYGSEL